MITATVTGADAVEARINRVRENLIEAVFTGLSMAGEYATQAMEDRTLEAHTQTGEERVAEAEGAGFGDSAYAGRVYTGRMIRSLRQDDGFPGDLKFSPDGTLDYTLGYVNNPQDYTRRQHYTVYSISGRLLSLQRGYGVMADEAGDFVKAEVDHMVHDTETGDYRPTHVDHSVWSG